MVSYIFMDTKIRLVVSKARITFSYFQKVVYKQKRRKGDETKAKNKGKNVETTWQGTSAMVTPLRGAFRSSKIYGERGTLYLF